MAIVSLFGTAFLFAIGFGVHSITARMDELAQRVDDNTRHLDRITRSFLHVTFRLGIVETDLWGPGNPPRRAPADPTESEPDVDLDPPR